MEWVEVARLLLSRGIPICFCGAGRSMVPLIRDGDRVVISPDLDRLRVGDIVFLSTPERPMLIHRIIRVSPDGIVTKGDAAVDHDGLIKQDRVLGKVIAIRRNDRWIKLESFAFRLISLGIACLSSLRCIFHKWLRRIGIRPYGSPEHYTKASIQRAGSGVTVQISEDLLERRFQRVDCLVIQSEEGFILVRRIGEVAELDEFYILNITGLKIWEGIDGTKTGRELSEHLFPGNIQATSDVRKLFSDLLEAGLIYEGVIPLTP
jgi:hypothetical protein